jgi:lysophospholipase
MELVGIPENPIPGHAIITRVVTPDGVALRVARWRSTARRTLGTVLIVQGRAEFIEKYFETIVELRRKGFAVLAFDFRGQGGSDRQLADTRQGHVDDFLDYITDLNAVRDQVLFPSLPEPYFALCHSMGSSVLLQALELGEKCFDRVVLSAPLVGLKDVRFPWLVRAVASALDFVALGTRYVPGGGATVISQKPFPKNRLTSDPVRYRRIGQVLEAGPHLGIGDPTIRWVHAMFQQFSRFEQRDFGIRLSVPSVMVMPGADPLCDMRKAAELAARIRACQPIQVPGARHELLTERDPMRQQFLAAFHAFIPGETHEDDLVNDEVESDEAKTDQTVSGG